MTKRILIIGGGPAGYEAALAGAKYGANITLVEDQGLGGSAVIYDCVPSKSFIAGTGIRTDIRRADDMGLEQGIGDAVLHLEPGPAGRRIAAIGELVADERLRVRRTERLNHTALLRKEQIVVRSETPLWLRTALVARRYPVGVAVLAGVALLVGPKRLVRWAGVGLPWYMRLRGR